jgi:hypothetical protein
MSFAFLDDLYNDETDEKDYGLIVNNILNVDKEPGLKKDKFTRFSPANDQSNELNYSNLEDMSKLIEKKYNNKKSEEKIKKNIKKNIKKKENFTTGQNEIEQCEKFIEHLSKCSRCRQFLIKKLNLDKNPDDIKREQYLDLAIFTLSGIFVLFLLDIVLNFGKSLNKK